VIVGGFVLLVYYDLRNTIYKPIIYLYPTEETEISVELGYQEKVYWLLKLQENEYNYIRFATMEEINSNMPLYFSVEPDTLIRVLMTYKGLNKPIDIQE
jgi:hypothetical protein